MPPCGDVSDPSSSQRACLNEGRGEYPFEKSRARSKRAGGLSVAENASALEGRVNVPPLSIELPPVSGGEHSSYDSPSVQKRCSPIHVGTQKIHLARPTRFSMRPTSAESLKGYSLQV